MFFNEAEDLAKGKDIAEPELEEVVINMYKRKKTKGKRESDLAGFDVQIMSHELTDEELLREFPNGYKRLPDEIYKKLEFHPATFEVIEHHLCVYKDVKGTKVVKAEHPKELLNNSIATPSLVSAIINAKYVNAVPLYRQEQEFERNDVHLSRQVMANWMIKSAERYLSLVYDRLRAEIISMPIVHADETPVMVSKDGREGMHKSYMWVYRTGSLNNTNTAVIYEYQKTRKKDAPEKFLKGFSGKLVCDGYKVYHSLEKDAEFTVAGCWTHARRYYADVIKASATKPTDKAIATKAINIIAKIYQEENKLKDKSSDERLKLRQQHIKPLVEAYFACVREHEHNVLPKSATGKAFTYSLNQEKYLKTFLDDGDVPIDNNAVEQAIRPFCVGKKNWKLIDTVHGAKASAIIYSIVETAKANNLKPYEYLKHLLTEIPKHMDSTNLNFIEALLPWSEQLPDACRKKK